MFLVRSAFWLTMAFVVLHPRDIDLGATASAISGRAIAAGQEVVTNQILHPNCSLLGCPETAKAAPVQNTASLELTSAALPMQGSSISSQAPYPRVRPGWMS